MANEFVIKNGFRSQGNSEVTGSLNITGGITGSISGSIVAPGSISQIIFNNAGVLAGANNVYFRTTGRLGIGTDSPTARLAITGSSSDLLFRLSSPSNSDILVVSGSGVVGLGTSTPSASLHISGASSAALLQIDSPASSSILFVSGSGNVGIRTNSPFSPLTVNGVVSSGNNLGAGGGSTINGELRSYQLDASTPLYLSLQTTGNGKSGIFRSNTDYILWYNLVTGDTVLNSSFGGASIKFTLQNSEKASIFSNGNFVIGTTTDSGARLNIRGSGATSSTTALRVENTNASASLAVLDDGTVGVGTSTTSRTLQVNGSFRVNRTNQTSQYWDLETGEANFGRLRHVSDSNNQKGLTISNILSGATPPGFWNFISFDVQNGEALRIDAAKNIGIGTSAPSASLHISGASSAALFEIDSPALNNILFVSGSGNVGIGTSTVASASLVVNSAGGTPATNIVQFTGAGTQRFNFRSDGVMAWGQNVNSAAYGFLNWDTNKSIIGSVGTNNLSFFTNSSERMFISASGLIGIGTSTPSASLHISGASSATLLRVDSPASSSILFVSGSGNVGIGTATPAFTLDVNGTARVQNISYIGPNELRPFSSSIAVDPTGRNLAIIPSNTVNTLIDSSGAVFIRSNTVTTTANLFTLCSIQTIFSPTSGTGINNNLTIHPVINQTGGANGITRGLLVSPTLTAAADFRAIENTVGNNLFNSTSGNTYIGLSTNTGTAKLQVRGAGATSATNTFIVQNSTPSNLLTIQDNGQFTFTSPIISLATSQSAFTISQSISQSAVIGAQVYGVNITPTFFSTTASQTETAFRVAATFTGSAAATAGNNIIADLGATSVGSQFTVTDVTSGSIYMVNDVSGLPILEATSDWTVNMYNFPNIILQKTGSQVNINGTLRVSGSFILPLSQSATPQTGSAYWSGSFLFVYDGTRYRSSSFA